MQKREFQFEEGNSRKFWSVSTSGSEMTVRFGRLGTAGQEQKKAFANDAAAEKEASKLIAEKTKKGYLEVAASPDSAPIPLPELPEGSAGASELTPTKTAPAQAAPSSKADAAQPSTPLVREVRLDPEFYFIRSWDQLEPLPRPPEAAFDLELVLTRVEAVGTLQYAWERDWRKARIPARVSRDEAALWVRAFRLFEDNGLNGAAVASQLRAGGPDGPLAHHALRLFSSWLANERLQNCAIRVLELADLVNLPDDLMREIANGMRDLARTFRREVLPYLTAVQRTELLHLLESEPPRRAQVHYLNIWFPSGWLRALLGQHAAVEEMVGTLHKEPYPNTYSYELSTWLVFGLGSPERVQAEFTRLGMVLQNSEEAHAWLALHGLAGAAEIANSACQVQAKEECQAIARALLRVQGPEGALPALRLQRESKAQSIGLEWLQSFPLEAAVGLVPVAMQGGPLAEAAREHLELMQRGATLPAHARDYLAPAEVEWLEREVIAEVAALLPTATLDDLPAPLAAEFRAVKNPKPTLILAAALPHLRVGNAVLAAEQVTALLHVLKSAPLGPALPLCALLREHAERNSLDKFAWKLCDLWLGLGAPSKEKWAFQAVGHLGGDLCVFRLTPLLRAWPGESQHQRAVLGLQVLRAIGSDTALMALNGVAQKVKFKGLKEKAQTLMEEIAASRGLSREQLADRIVPDCDLDARGSRTFDFGARQFTFVLGPEMKPHVRDPDGKVRSDLPAPNSSDDAAKAEAAVADWKLLKKTLREVLKVQADRLEDAMISGRRWSAEEFRTLLVGHPLMVNLTRLLIFAAYDESGRAVQTFRVTEDQTLADAQDDTVADLATDRVGVVHPAHLDPAALAAWGQVLGDYAIIPPFPQLGRPIFAPEPGDLELKAIVRFKGPKIPGIVVYGILERSHWLRDKPADGGGFRQHSKYFPAAEVTAFIAYEPGLTISYYEQEQEISEVYFVPGHVKPDWWGQHEKRYRIKDVDPVVLSEVLRLAHAIAAKA